MNVGYKLVAEDGKVLASWGGIVGQMVSVPDRILLPNGDCVHCPELGINYDGCSLVVWEMDPPAASARRLTPYRIVRRLEEAGLLSAANALLDANLTFKWRFTTAADIAVDDSDLVAGLAAIGADPSVILAPE